MIVYLVRHADAAPGRPDELRPLTAHGKEQSAITDFMGLVGSAHLQGTGLASDRPDRLHWDADVRFMDGVFVGLDSERHRGSLGFI